MIQDVKKIYLCDLNLKPITQLNGIQTDTVSLSRLTKDIGELTFEVDEYVTINGEQIKSNGYDDLDLYMTIYLEDTGMYQMQKPTESGDGQKHTKSVIAYSLEKEFEDKNWINFKVNTGAKDSLEQLATGNLNDMGFAKEFVSFYNPDNKELSFIDLVLEYMPAWSYDPKDIDILLVKKKMPSIEEKNISLYNLMTSRVAPRMECLFLFDTIHRKIKVVAKENLNDKKYESTVFIGYRNLAKQIDVSVNEDTVFTRFNCHGDNELNILNVNYQDNYIYNLDYFMRSPYMTEELILKTKKWTEFRESHREEYINLSKQWADNQEASSELQNRVPADNLYTDQWDNMNKEGLEENLKYYNTLLTSLQVSVDPNWHGSEDGNDYTGYEPWKKPDGTVDHDRYLEELKKGSNGYGGYYTYFDVLHYIIPNIEIALKNLDLPEDKKEEYKKDWETNWDLYGITELEAKQKEYNTKIEKLSGYKKPWADLTEEEKKEHTNEENYNIYHNQYVEAEKHIDALNKALETRKAEKKIYDDKIKEINTSRNSIADQASLDNKSFGFTVSDLITIRSLFHDTDYQNTNIFSTSLTTTRTEIDCELDLFNDSVSKLSEVSQPQYTFSVQMDNLFNIPEFKHWKGQIDLLKFIRLGIRDDYSVKLRVIGITYNPCEITPDITLDFSNMITSRSGRSDLTELIETENNRGAKNSFTFGTGDSDDEKEYLTALLQLMIKNGLFQNAVGNIAGGTVGQLDEAEVNRLIAKYLKNYKVEVGHIVGDKAEFNELFAKYIDAEFITAQIIQGQNGDFIDFINSHIKIDKITVDQIVGPNGENFIDMVNGVIDVKKISTELITGGDGNTFIDFVNNTIQSSTIKADKITGIENSKTFIDFVNNQIATSDLSADIGNIENILSGFAGIGDIQNIHLTTQNAVIDKAVIKELIASQMSVADLMAHQATAELITLIGKNGQPTIAFKDSTQQFYDANGNIRVQIGQDGNGQFNFIVRGEDGTTAMFDENGITKDGIPNNIIVNNMLANGTIQKDKLGFQIIEPNAQGGIDISQVYLGDGSKFGVEYTTFKETVTNDINSMNQKIDESSSYELYIEMPNGNRMTPAGLTLNARLFKNSVEVTPDWDNKYFTWRRHSNDHDGDINWNNIHNEGTKTLLLTSNDVYKGAMFECKFETDSISVSKFV